MKNTGELEWEGVAANGFESATGECGIDTCGSDELTPDDIRRRVTKMGVALGQEMMFGERTLPDVVKLRVLEECLACL